MDGVRLQHKEDQIVGVGGVIGARPKLSSGHPDSEKVGGKVRERVGATLSDILRMIAGREGETTVYYLFIAFGVILVLIVMFGSLLDSRVPIVAGILLIAFVSVIVVSDRHNRSRAEEHREEAHRLREKEERLLAKEQRLSDVLGIPPESTGVGLYLPMITSHHAPERGDPYEVESLASSDVLAAVEIVCLLDELDLLRGDSMFDPSKFYVEEGWVKDYRGSTLFLIGGPLPNRHVGRMVARDPFVRFADYGLMLAIETLLDPTEQYAIRPPRGDRSIADVRREDTYGCVMKQKYGARQTRFAIWGLDERGTLGAARWLAECWEDIYLGCGDGTFTAVVRIPGLEIDPEPPELRSDQPLWLPTSG